MSAELEGYKTAYWEIVDALGIGAMAMSPAQGHVSVVMPKLRELLASAPTAQPSAKDGVRGEGFPPAAVWNDQYQGWVIPKRHGLTVLCEQSAIVWNECRELCLAATQPPAGTAQGEG